MGLGKGWISAEMLTPENISASIRDFKEIHNIRSLAEQAGYEGDELDIFRADTCREIIMKIAKLDLLSRHDHYCDVTIELMKAEIALKLNLPYQQDKLLKFNQISVR